MNGRMKYEYQGLQHSVPPTEENMAALQDMAREGWRVVGMVAGQQSEVTLEHFQIVVLYLERTAGRTSPLEDDEPGS